MALLTACRNRRVLGVQPPFLWLLMLVALFPACSGAPRFYYDFETDQELDRLEWRCKSLFRLAEQHATSGSRSLMVELYPDSSDTGEHYPGVKFIGFNPDWSRYHSLCFDAYNPEQVELRLTVRIDDRKNPDYPDRYNGTIRLAPGPNHVALPLGSLITSGSRRNLDLTSIRGVLFFLVNPKERHTIFLDRVLVE